MACLFALLLVASGEAGCMVPAPLFEEDQENSPVWVDENQLQPALLEQPVPVQRRTGGMQSFEVGEVWDDDVGDSIYLRWFVNWQSSHSIKFAETLPPNGTALRQSRPFPADFCAGDLRGLSDLVLVEAVVSDRDFLTDTLGRTVREGATMRTVSWLVKLLDVCPSPEGGGQ